MAYNILALITGCVYCFFMAVIFFSSLKRSNFGYVIMYHEYFYILGVGFFPLLASLNVIGISPTFLDYEVRNGGLSNMTFVHIVLYGFGSFLGYFLARPIAINFCRKKIKTIIAKFSNFPNYKWFYFSSLSSIFLSLLYFNLVGVDVALLNASLARSGIFSGLIGFERYSFIKTLAQIGQFSVISLPFIILSKKGQLLSFFVLSIMTILLYLQSVARVIFFDTILLFILFYFMFNKDNSIRTVVLVFLGGTISLFVIIYGKEFVVMLSMYLFSDGEFELVEKYDDFGLYFFAHFGHLVYSIDAGIKNFIEHGSVIPQDILLAPIGLVPSFIYSDLGLDFLSYQLLDFDQRLSCINTTYFPSEYECSMPPYIHGFSAYILPMSGGFIFGFFRFFTFGVLEIFWIELQTRPELLWVVMVVFIIFVKGIMLFIPNTISLAFFYLLVLYAFIFFQKIKLRIN